MLLTAFLPIVLAATFTPTFSEKVTSPEGALRLGLGTLSTPLQGDLRRSTRDWALAHRAELGLPATSTLSTAQAFGTRHGASFHLWQQVDGIDVYGARAVVTLDRNRRVVQVSSSVVGYTQAVMDWRLKGTEALALASKDVPLALMQPSGSPYGGVKQAVFVVGSEAHSGYLAWVPTLNQLENWYVAIDAVTRQVLWKENRVYRAADDAQVYASSPGHLDAGVGVTPLVAVQLRHADGGPMMLPDAGGFLTGTQIDSANCCPWARCDATAPDAGPKRLTGSTTLPGLPFAIPYDVVACDRRQTATNDPTLHDAGSYWYAPIDPPVGETSTNDPADQDSFSEVHAFYHVNSVYDFMRSLSTAAQPVFPGENIQPFVMRGERLNPPRKPAVWTNTLIPDFNEMMSSLLSSGVARSNHLIRVDNAIFQPVEQFQQVTLPGFANDVDTLVIFQASKADFGYDATVLWHEFGHGVIFSTAAFDSLAIDQRSANNEGGALHEGFADFIAAVYGQRATVGDYVGPRITSMSGGPAPQDASLRDLENDLSCPGVLWGEVHQDSQHVSAALWKARKDHFLGSDQGRSFDAAFYAALVSMSPTTDFAQAAAIIAAHADTAFPGVQAADKLKAIFDARGVTNCSKVLDITNATPARRYYGISGGGSAKPQALVAGAIVPGPFQFHMSLPNGASKLLITGKSGGQMSLLGQEQTQSSLLVRAGSPITFTRNGTVLTNDAVLTQGGTLDQSRNLTIQADFSLPCGSELYFTVGTASAGGEAFQDLKAQVTPLASCTPGSDGGTGDGGSTDGGGQPVAMPSMTDGAGNVRGTTPEGCGCAAVDAGSLGLSLAGALALLRARRRR